MKTSTGQLYNGHSNLNDYQKKCLKTAVYPRTHSIVYPALGLAGEAGEVADKVKKILRDDIDSPEYREQIMLELGDVLWYVSVLAYDLGYDLETVARRNADKLKARQQRGTLHGSGDGR